VYSGKEEFLSKYPNGLVSLVFTKIENNILKE